MGTQIRDIVEVNITRESARVTQQGFGTPMIFGEHARFSDRVRSYNDPADMLTDGFLVTDNHYLAALSLMSQDLSPTLFKVGRKLGDFNAIQGIAFTGTATAGTWTLTLDAETTAGIAWDAALSAIESAIEALTAVTSVSVSGSLAEGLVIEFLNPGLQVVNTVTVDISSLTGVTAAAVSVVQVGSAVETWTVGYTALVNEGAGGDDDWYALGILSRTKQDILDIAALIEASTTTKIFFGVSEDSDIAGSGSGDLASALKALDYDRSPPFYLTTAGQNAQQKVVPDANPSAGTFTITLDGVTSEPIAYDAINAVIATALENMTNIGSVTVTGIMDTTGFTIEWDGVDGLKPINAITVDVSSLTGVTSTTITQEQTGEVSFPEFAWMGGQLPKDPGSITWWGKTLTGITPDVLTTTAVTNIKGKNCNIYETIGGVNIVHEGVVPSGEFIDIIRGVDWIQARISENVFSLMVNADKIPFTDPGVEMIKSEIQAVLEDAVDRGILVANTITITAPKVADVSSVDKANRFLPDVIFGATLAGAIHKVKIDGKLSV
jgi:hypothetical protein